MTETIKTIKKIAEREHISQAQIARRAGFTEVSVCRWFKGERDPAIDTVERLANALDLKISVTIR